MLSAKHAETVQAPRARAKVSVFRFGRNTLGLLQTREHSLKPKAAWNGSSLREQHKHRFQTSLGELLASFREAARYIRFDEGMRSSTALDGKLTTDGVTDERSFRHEERL